MRNITSVKKLLWMLLIPLLTLSCEDEMKKHYEVPSWLKGSAWEVLKDKENYSLFLEAVELAGYRPIMEGKSILTVMAPDDTAFTSYLQKNGYASVSAMPKAELQKLIGFHLLYYSYNKEKLVNFHPEKGEKEITDEDKEVNAGMYYKFRTRSTNSPTQELNPLTNRMVTVYHLERFVPVFSYRFFATQGLDAKANYEYFYPNSTWKGASGFNVSNASVEEYSLLANNGYVYTIDQVLEPLETIYTELKNREGYSVFFNLYESYRTYDYDATLSQDYGAAIGADSLFLHKHGTALPPIAMEWPVSSYRNIAALSSISYSVFAPSNQALNTFFTNYWKKGGYTSLDQVDPLVMNYLLLQYVYGGSVVFPEQITKGKILNSFDAKIDFDPAAVTDRKMCINGSFYGIDKFITPALFNSVAGPAFQYKDYCNYLYMLDHSSLLLSLVSPDTKFITLIPSNKQLESEGIFLNENNGKKVLQKTGEDGNLAGISGSECQSVVNIHISSNNSTAFKTSGTQVHPTQTPFNYWYIKDGKITSSALFTQFANPLYNGDPFIPFKELKNDTDWTNGKAYEYEGTEIFRKESSDGLIHALAVCNDTRYPYYLFSQLLIKAGQISEDKIKLLRGRFIAFIPTNEAIKAALEAGTIPGVSKGGVAADGTLTGTYTANTLAGYINSYFVTSELNVLTTYPYPGSPLKSGTYGTPGQYPIEYTDNGTGLSVKMEKRTNTANVVSDYFCFPFAYEDGCFHLIDSTL